ncbi:phenylalanine--tRNA ligase subunit beta [Tepidamorphus sp. 3E244]|uniref:phenylalanine--tRNA ligase subunit beta n=1 Tax=Tepidamorphus sp. 3E244 TaxID=3385498 RepID=UPI0038FCCE93
MKFTLNWLKDHLETDESLEALADKLSLIGLEVESIENPAETFAPFKTARVVKAEQHPDADRLRVCIVDDGTTQYQVVCGAPNARTGMVGVFAPAGTHIPGTGMDLKPGVIRGVESNGMLVSEREMGLSDEHDGIIDLDADTAIGVPFAQVLGLDDPVIEIAITPNRGDCLGVHGVARDLAAAGMGKLKSLKTPDLAGTFDSPVGIEIAFDGDSVCPVFAGVYVKDVKNGPSPDWMQRRLKAIGLRPINALVDITNYVSYDRGRPLHVYDADKLTGTVRARMGKQGESFEALDGKVYEVDETMCVIADDANVLGLGGIMGGEESGSTEATVNVLIESAWFDPKVTARTGRALDIQSDARYRFERTVDPETVVPGARLAAQMVVEMCGGTPSNLVLAGEVPEADKVIDFDLSQVKRLTGLKLHPAEIKAILRELGFLMSGPEDNIKVAVPSWRPDVHESADLVEEVTRIVGVDAVPTVPLDKPDGVPAAVLTLAQTRAHNARRTLASRGLVEAVTWSFIGEADAKRFGGGAAAVKLSNPISSDLTDMRPSHLPGLIAAAQGNVNRGMGDVALFEIGATYHGDEPEDQVEMATVVRRGRSRIEATGRHWRGGEGAPDAFDAKADAVAVLASLGAPVDNLQVTRNAPDWYHPGRSGTLQLGPKMILAHFGELHPGVLDEMDIDGPVVAAEIFLDALPAPKKRDSRAKPAVDLPDLMPVTRDFAFLVDGEVEAQAILRAARGAEKKLISDVRVFDVYTGEALKGQKSIGIEVTLQPREQTLTEKDIEAVAERIVAQVAKATGGTLRN